MRRRAALVFAFAFAVAALPADGQEAPPAPPAPAPEDLAAKVGEAVGARAGAAYEAGRVAEAIALYREAIGAFGKAWPDELPRRQRRLLALHRSLAWCHARQGELDAVLERIDAAYDLVQALNGVTFEELKLDQAVYVARDALAATPERVLALFGGYRDLLGKRIDDAPGPRNDFVRRTRVRVGQAMHEIALVHERANDLPSAAAAFADAQRYRLSIPDVRGAAWSAQNGFWVLLVLARDAEAATRCAEAARLLAGTAGPGLPACPDAEIEASLAGNLERALAEWDATPEGRTRAGAFLRAVRAAGYPSPGLPTLPEGRLLAWIWRLAERAGPDLPADAATLADGLREASSRERQPAWMWLGGCIAARRAITETADPIVGTGARSLAREAATAALVAAEKLGDPRRIARARLKAAGAVAAGGDATAAEAAIQEIFAAAGVPGADPAIREWARREGARLAASAGNAEWAARYAESIVPRLPPPIEGHAIFGRDPKPFFAAIRECPGEGPVLAITRRDRLMILRSALYPGTLAVEWGPMLRYVSANGILLAIQGPDVAVVGLREEPSAPATKPGKWIPGSDLDPVEMLGETLPPFASQVTLPDGETAFVNRFLRISR